MLSPLPELANKQPISYRRFGQQVLRLRRIGFEFLPQVSHVNAQLVALPGVRRVALRWGTHGRHSSCHRRRNWLEPLRTGGNFNGA